MRQFEQHLVQKLRAKRPKLMPYKKIADGLHKQGTLRTKIYNSEVRQKTLIRLRSVRHLSSRPAHIH